MRRLAEVLHRLRLPLAAVSGITAVGSGMWLAALDELPLVLLGIGTMITGPIALFIILLQGVALLGAPIRWGSRTGVIVGNALSGSYAAAIMAVWCAWSYYFFLSEASPTSAVAASLWAYAVSLGPWTIIVRSGWKENWGGVARTNVFAHIGYALALLSGSFAGLSLNALALVFGGVMLAGLVVEWVLAFVLAGELVTDAHATLVREREEETEPERLRRIHRQLRQNEREVESRRAIVNQGRASGYLVRLVARMSGQECPFCGRCPGEPYPKTPVMGVSDYPASDWFDREESSGLRFCSQMCAISYRAWGGIPHRFRDPPRYLIPAKLAHAAELEDPTISLECAPAVPDAQVERDFSNAFIGWSLGAALALLVALLPLPQIYYDFLRFGVTAAAVVGLAESERRNRNGWVIGFVVIAILFNPLVPIYLDRATWQPLNVVAATYFFYSLSGLAPRREVPVVDRRVPPGGWPA